MTPSRTGAILSAPRVSGEPRLQMGFLMKRLLPTLLALAIPLAAGAQWLRPPDIGEALRQMDRQRARRDDVPQTLVLPERPGQNLVAWYDFEWRHYDIPSPSGGKGGIRLYYYQREAAVAEKALPVIRAAYLRLVDQFHYTPTKQIPYFLYSSKREFQTTNVFEVGESVLGVTSPRDLKMSLPYFGDHEKFREVSTHEMVHQFTIQKLLDIAGADELAFLQALPLWFIEGIAEYYAKGGLDTETDMFLRDLVWNPDPQQRYQILAFVEDRLRGYIPTYKMGQARVAFIAETYGKEKIQALLENAYVRGAAEASPSSRPAAGGFAALVRRVLNDTPEQVDARWRAWLKHRYYPEYIKVRQDLPQVHDYTGMPAEPEAFAASPDGWLVLFRGIDRERGRARLYLFDTRNPRGAVEVASDNHPGVESLHPVEQNVLAVGDRELAFVAQDGSSDSLYLVPFRHEPPKDKKPPRLSLGSRRRIELRHPGGHRFVELGDPAFSPDGKSIAFTGLTDLGQRDVYVVPTAGGAVRQLTDDAFSERDVAWGKDGVYFTSDATDHGRENLFRADASSGAVTRLTTEPADDRHPRPQPDGSVLFTSDASGKPDLYRLSDGQVRRLSDFATGLSAPQAAPDGRGIYATTFYHGRFRLVELPRVAFLEEAPVAVAPAAGPVLPIPLQPVPDATPRYDPYSWRSWRPEAGYVFGGGGGSVIGVQAAAIFTDLFRDRQLLVDLSVLGSFDYTQALVLYEDRHERTSWVWGAYHIVNQQIDRHDFSLAFFQRDFGGVGILRYPLDRYQRLDLELSAGGVQRYCLTDFSVDLPAYCGGLRHTPLPGVAADWDRVNGGVSPVVGPTLRYGYDTVRFDPLTGPIDGSSLLLELGGNWLPTRGAVNGFARLDAAHWWPIIGRSNFMLRASAGSSFAPDSRGVNWARAWWLSSADNLRGFYPLDTAYLIGMHYYVANAELQVPLDAILRLFIFDYIEGVAAFDFGGVANQLHDKTYTFPDGTAAVAPGLWEARTLTGVLGFNVLFGPFLLRVHFGHPFDIGGEQTPAMLSGTRWVTNVSLRLLFF